MSSPPSTPPPAPPNPQGQQEPPAEWHKDTVQGPMPRPYPSIPNYQIESMIGEGGMGAVFKATQVALNRKVAIKTLNKRVSSDPQFRERFKREAQILARMQHPNIVACYDFGETEGLIYVVMEYIEGENLGAVLARRQSLPWTEAVTYLKPAIVGLDYASAMGVIHRDIKPENLLISKPPARQTTINLRLSIKLVDMGLACMESQDNQLDGKRLTQVGMLLGSPHYMSPEQLNGEMSLDFRSDIYSLGIMFYQMLTGVLPYHATTITAVISKKLTEPLPDPRTYKSHLPSGLTKVLQRMAARERGSRYSSYGELLRDLELMEKGLEPVTAQVLDAGVSRMQTPLNVNVGPLSANPADTATAVLSSGRQQREKKGWGVIAGAACVAVIGAVIYAGTAETKKPTAPEAKPVVAEVRPAAKPAQSALAAPVNLIENKTTKGWRYAGPEIGFGFQDDALFIQALQEGREWLSAEREMPAAEGVLKGGFYIPLNAERCEVQLFGGGAAYYAFGIRMPDGAKEFEAYAEQREAGTHKTIKALAKRAGFSSEAPLPFAVQIWESQAAYLVDGKLLFCAEVPSTAAPMTLRLAVNKGVGQFRELVMTPRPEKK